MRSGNPKSLGLSGLQKRLVWHLRVHGPTPRTELAQALEQSHAALTKVTRELMMLGLIQEVSAVGTGHRGRPLVPLSVSGEGLFSAGATCHPGWIEVVLIDFVGTVLAQDTQAFDSKDPRDFAVAAKDMLAKLGAQLGLTRRRFLGLGVAVPGYLLGQGERRAVVPWLLDWHDQPLGALFEEILQMPVWIENDGTAAALAEFYQPRVLRAHANLIVFFLGHGVGGGLIVARDICRGEHGNAGEIGRLFPRDQPRPSGVDLLRCFQAAGLEVADLRSLSSEHLLHLPILDPWISRVADQLRFALTSGAAWLDPGAVVVSGSLPAALLTRIANRLQRLEQNDYRGPQPTVLASDLAGSAVCIGAGLVPVHEASR